jgi:molybdopterin synthase catalytic subunit
MVRLSPAAFDPYQELQQFGASVAGAGAVASFVGFVRPPALSLEIDHHRVLTEQMIVDAQSEAADRWGLTGALVIHRIGVVGANEPIVLVATAALHRREALQSCDYLMDYLKTEAPLWKKEVTPAGARWIEPRPQDYDDAARWRSGQCTESMRN